MDSAQLVIQCKSGDRDALGQLYDIYAPLMMRVIESRIHNHDVAQDILHDGFIIAFSSLSSLNKVAKFESWLTTIMRNLSLQYLRESSNHVTIPVADTSDESFYDDGTTVADLSWDELNKIIDRLPDGYSKVFRLAVLDGHSHKEIGEMLGIAPHSSSSQLSHAKAMLRRLITEYRISIRIIGITSVIVTTILIWLGLNRKYETENPNLTAFEADKNERNANPDLNVEPTIVSKDTMQSSEKIISNRKEASIKENLAGVKLPQDTIIIVFESDTPDDTIPHLKTIPVNDKKEWLANNDTPIEKKMRNGWSLALAYSGNSGQNTDNRYRIPIGPEPDLPTESPEEIDITEKSRHYMPIVIGLSFNRSLSSQWSVESGIRYTLLRSDLMRESEIERTETNQRIHYIGIPLKLNYHITGNTRFSLYSHGGIGLDIPVNGKQSIIKWERGWNKPEFEHLAISAPLQWSVDGGLGFQYRVTPSFSIYAEPSFRYYFNPRTDVKTIRQDKPFEFIIPIGIRLNW